LKDSQYAYKLSILKSFCNTSDFCIRHYYNYEKGVPGVGHCIHTYSQDGNPLPSYRGEPFELELYNDINETVELYWDILNVYNKISILAKYINIEDGSFEVRIINKYKYRKKYNNV